MGWTDPRNALAVLTGRTARRGGIAVIDQAIVSGTTFLVALLLARACSRHEFGTYALAFSVVAAARTLQAALLTGPMNVLGAAKDGEAWRRYFSILLVCQVLFALSGAAIVIAAAFALGALGVLEPETRGLLLAVAAALFFVQVREFFRRAAYVRMRALRALLNDSVFCVILLGAVAALWRSDGREASAEALGGPGLLGVANVFWCMAGAAAIGSAVGFFQVKSDLTGRALDFRACIAETWDFGKWGLGGFLYNLLLNQAHVWLIASVLGIAAVGIVEAARLLAAPLRILLLSAPNVITPRTSRCFSEGGKRALRLFLRRAAPPWLLAFLAYGTLVAAAPGFWLELLFPGKYADAGPVLILWLVIMVVTGFCMVPAWALGAMRRPDVGMKIGLVVGPLAFGLTALLAWQWGVTGAVSARLIGEVIRVIILAAMAWRLLKGDDPR